jgi:hypothetical protein
VAKGRREGPLAAPVEIPPPGTGWRFRIVDLDLMNPLIFRYS